MADQVFIVLNVKNKLKMVNKILAIFLSSILLISCVSKVDYQENTDINPEEKYSGYVAGTQDIPLFLDLEIIEEESTNFDTLSGNINIASYVGEANLEEVKDFYMITLPQIGFKLRKDKHRKLENDGVEHLLSYKRNGSRLEISFKKIKKELLVKFLISSN